MTKRLQVGVSLKGKDLEMFLEIQGYLNEQNIIPSDSEIMKMCMRGYYYTNTFEVGGKRDWKITQQGMLANLEKKEEENIDQ